LNPKSFSQINNVFGNFDDFLTYLNVSYLTYLVRQSNASIQSTFLKNSRPNFQKRATAPNRNSTMSSNLSLLQSQISIYPGTINNNEFQESKRNYKVNSVNLRNRSLGLKNRRVINSKSKKMSIKRLFVKKGEQLFLIFFPFSPFIFVRKLTLVAKKKEVNLDLYFVDEKKRELPKDLINLVKLDMIKKETISNFNKKIKVLKTNMNVKSVETNDMIKDYNQSKVNLQNNSQMLNREKIQQEIQFQEIDKISKSILNK
jgi:hypothetical protein